MRSGAIILSAVALSACQSDARTTLEKCLPGVGENRARGLVVHTSAPGRGSATTLLSETCKLQGLALEFDPADRARVDALSDEQDPGAWLIDGEIASIDYGQRTAKLAPGAKIAIAPHLDGDQLWYRFRNEKPLQ